METNVTESIAHKVGGKPPNIFTAMIDWGPMMTFVWYAIIIVCIVVVWFAMRNIFTIFRHEFGATEQKSVNCRIAISQYMIIFLSAVWLLDISSSIQYAIWNLAMIKDFGEAQKAMMYLDMEPPVIIAWVLVALAGIHGAAGIAFAIRKRKIKD